MQSGRGMCVFCVLVLAETVTSSIISNATEATLKNCTSESGDKIHCLPQLTGNECTIESFGYSDSFLSMKSGWWYKYAVLEKGDPRGLKNWKWRAVWRITEIDVEGEILHLLKDQKTDRYLSFNRQMYSYLRGESNPRMMDNLWKIARVGGAGERVTLQRHLPPREYLHASQHTKGDERQLEMHTDPYSNSNQWLVHCDKS